MGEFLRPPKTKHAHAITLDKLLKCMDSRG